MKLVAIKMIDVLWKNENLEMIKKKKKKKSFSQSLSRFYLSVILSIENLSNFFFAITNSK